MRIARLALPDEQVVLARIDGDDAVPIGVADDRPGTDPLRDLLAGSAPPADVDPVAASVPLEECTLLSPVAAPDKVLCIGLNYADHAREAGVDPPQQPVVFAKTGNTLIGSRQPIRFRTSDSSEVDYEAELAAVIGRHTFRVSPEDALQHVFGYTAANDVSARDVQLGDGQWVRGKSFDTFCPLGPWIVTADELDDAGSLTIECRVNGQVRQSSSTEQMIFPVAILVSILSQVMTLLPGDLILTGTPFGVGAGCTPPAYLRDGDVVDVSIQGIGTLTNPVVTE